MKVNIKKPEELAFSGDIVIIKQHGEDKVFMLVEDNDQGMELEELLYFVDLTSGISYKHIIRKDSNTKFVVGYDIPYVGKIKEVVRAKSIDIIL